MTSTRINAEGELQILHPETGAYVPSSVLLQVEGGLLAALVPDQIALLSDIQKASGYLRLIEGMLSEIKTELFSVDDRLKQSNDSLIALSQINAALDVIKNTIDSLATLNGATNTLLIAVQSEIVALSEKIPTTLGAKIKDASLSVALATDSSIFTFLANILNTLSDTNDNSIANSLTTLSAKIPTSLGAKPKTASLSVALASDSTVFASLDNILATLTGTAGGNSVYNALTALSAKIPTSLGAKLRAESLSVALASDSTVFASLNSIVSSLSDGGFNSVYSRLVALSAKLPESLGAKLRTESMSVALATDSTIFTSLTNILNALSDGGTNSALSYLNTIATAQAWQAPTRINGTSPVFNAVSVPTSGTVAYTLNAKTRSISIQNFFSVSGATCKIMLEFRLVSGSSTLSDRVFYSCTDTASGFQAGTGAFAGDNHVVIPTHGYGAVVVHLSAISSGNISVFVKEIR